MFIEMHRNFYCCSHDRARKTHYQKNLVLLVLIHCHLNVFVGLFFSEFYIHQTAICDASVTVFFSEFYIHQTAICHSFALDNLTMLSLNWYP